MDNLTQKKDKLPCPFGDFCFKCPMLTWDYQTVILIYLSYSIG